MVQMPAKCVNPRCGYVDPEPGAIWLEGNVSGSSFIGNAISNGCKKCGSDMLLFEGKFSVREEELILDDGPEWTRRSLWEIRTALEYARDNLHSRPDEARQRVEEISPSLAAVIWDRASGRNAMAIAAYLGLVIGVISF
ncbi:MAG: hypothetical protein ACK4M5_00360, partial [Dietzia cercidiphylli]